MKFNTLVLIAGLTLSFTSGSALANNSNLSARDIMIKNEKARKADISEVAELEMTLTNKAGDKRVRRVTFILDDTDANLRKSYVKFLSPRNVEGTAFVQLEHEVKENDRWLYLPSLRKTRRISGNAKTDSFVGTDFSFEDFEILDGKVAGRNRNYTIIKEEQFKGEDCWVIEALPANDKEKAVSGYSKRLLWISKQNFHALFTQFYDRQGTLFKEMESSNFALVPGGTRNDYRPHRLTMKTLKTGHSTTIDFQNFVLNQSLDQTLFTRENLSRS